MNPDTLNAAKLYRAGDVAGRHIDATEERAHEERIERMQRMMQEQWDDMTDEEARTNWNAWCG